MARKKSNDKMDSPQSLRERAEELLRTQPEEVPAVPTKDVQQLVYELNVYQMELEIQNQELRETQLELANMRDCYADLYEFAPIGYITLNKEGKIQEANLTAALLLGVERDNLLQANLSKFVTPDSQDALYLHRQAVFSSEEKLTCEIETVSPKGNSLWLRLESIRFGEKQDWRCRTVLVDITEPKKADIELKHLNEELERRVGERTQKIKLLSQAITHLGEGVLITNDHLEWPGPHIVFVNDAMCRISGYKADDLLGKTPRILQGDGTDRATLDRIKTELSAGRPCSFELVNYRKDGTPYDAEVFITPLFNSEGHRTNFVSIHLDITERKKGEKALKESEELTNAILSSLSSHIAVIDGEGWIKAVNPAWEEFASNNEGIASQCNVGANYLEVCLTAKGMYSDEAPKVAKGLRAVLDAKIAEFTIEYPCHSPAEERWFLLQATPLRYGKGGAVVSHTNITARIQAQRSLQEREERLRVILNTAADAIITIDQRGIIQSVNPATEKMFGYALDELLGQNVRMLMPQPYQDEHDNYLARFLETGEPRIIGIGRETQACRKDGTVFPIDLAVSQVDHLGLFTGVIRDITERKKFQEQILEIAAEEQRRIGHDLHDDVGQELTGLSLTTDTLLTLLKRTSSPEVDIARRLLEDLKRTTQKVRSLSRGLNPVEVDPEGLMAALGEMAKRITDLHKINCEFICEKPVRFTSAKISTHLYHIVQEATNNAIKHGQAQNIQIQLEEHQSLIKLRIRDDGVGIDSPTGDKSNGLGLRIMRYRADLIHANFSIGRHPQGGTLLSCALSKEGITEESLD